MTRIPRDSSRSLRCIHPATRNLDRNPDVHLPCLRFEAAPQDWVEGVLWLSPRGARTGIHQDDEPCSILQQARALGV